MLVAIISDIHGNLPALEAVLADLETVNPDRTVCLGDVAATGPFPREALERVRALGCPVVLGNTDDYLLNPRPEIGTAENTRRVQDIDAWCAAQLSAADLDFLRSFRPVVEIPLDGGMDLLCYHGSPRSYNDKISATTPDAEVEPMLAGQRARVMAGGHWHFQLLRRYQDLILLNPGSVGLVFDTFASGEVRVPARAEYAVIRSEGLRLSVDLRRVPYDRDATVRAMFERGMPHAEWWSAAWR
jgi:predicted phosphodiesterase